MSNRKKKKEMEGTSRFASAYLHQLCYFLRLDLQQLCEHVQKTNPGEVGVRKEIQNAFQRLPQKYHSNLHTERDGLKDAMTGQKSMNLGEAAISVAKIFIDTI